MREMHYVGYLNRLMTSIMSEWGQQLVRIYSNLVFSI